MAQSDNNTNTVNINGDTRVPSELPALRSRNTFLQKNFVGRRIIAGSEQYVTPPARSVRIFQTFWCFLPIFFHSNS